MPYKAAVTFESNTLAPKTWRGEIVAGSPAPAVRRAVATALKALGRTHWSSVSVLLTKIDLDRIEDDYGE